MTRKAKMPKPSSRTASHNGRERPSSLLLVRSQARARIRPPSSAVPPDHLVARAAPNASPVATRQGRKTGEGGRSGGRWSSRDSSARSAGGGGGGVRRSIHRRSSTRNRKPATAKVATKMSSIEIRDCTKFKFSAASSRELELRAVPDLD